jgi:predicted ATPase/class 3 adenylate cyclase/DNA-binding winged helix-turn-helix (wHTH) protein
VVEFRILGPLEIEAGGELLALGSAQQRAVLALLLVQAREPVSVDRLIDELWGERPPATAQHAVQVYVSGIRKILRTEGGGVAVRSSRSGYVLDLDPEQVDARRFERLVGEAQRVLADDPPRAGELCGEALELWRAAPLAEFSQFEFARMEADRLEELRAVAVEGLVQARLACGEHSEVIGVITGLVAADPLREHPRRLLMLALYRGGRHAEALAAYRDACAALDEIGLQPGPELRQLEQAILRHDPSLSLSSSATDAGTSQVGTPDSGSAPSDVDRRALPTSGKVTMLFTDIEGSSALLDRLGDRYPELLTEHNRVIREAITAAGGHEVVVAGDSFFVAFADAPHALECAHDAQLRLADQKWPGGASVRVRMGIHTGTPEVRDGDYVGMDVHRAARVMAAAHGGQVLITRATKDASPASVEVVDLGHHRLKDLPAPEHLFQLLAPGLPKDFPPVRSLNRSNLPSVANALVGRSSELSTALKLIARGDVRLVTMLGPGGSGKTRMAWEVAARAVDRYPDGVWFVSLAPIADPALVASEIARTLGVKETAGETLAVTLADALARRELLLLLDNFEHLIPAAGLVSELLEAAPHLDVLVTSREALRLRGEHRMEIPPLALQDAAELFMERAFAIRLDLAEDAREREAVDRICLRLDRLPLALELAAARVALFSISALEARLAQRLALPDGARDLPERQRTLRATIDWSYQLLSPGEQTLFRGLAPFAGGARLEAIESTFADLELDSIQTVAALVDKSLLRRSDDPYGQPRFWMLETIREYAAECLTKCDESGAAAARHAAYFLDFAESAEPLTHTRNQPAWLERLESDHDNLRAAFDHLVERAPSQALRLAASLGDFWEIRGHLSESRERLRRALACAPTASAAAAKASFLAGRFAFFQGEADKAEPLYAEALRLAREADDFRVEVLALTHIGMVAQALGDAKRSVELNEEALAIARGQNDDWILGVALNNLGDTFGSLGDIARGRPLLEEALEVSHRMEEPMGITQTAANLAGLALASGDLDAAEPLIAEALRRAGEIDYRSIVGAALVLDALLALHRGDLDTAALRIPQSLEAIRIAYHVVTAGMLLAAAATLAAAHNDPLRAAQLWAASDQAMGRLGIDATWCGANRLRDEWLPKARGAVNATDWNAAWQAGRRLLPEEALALVR